jgi:hypothetical protein
MLCATGRQEREGSNERSPSCLDRVCENDDTRRPVIVLQNIESTLFAFAHKAERQPYWRLEMRGDEYAPSEVCGTRF